MRAGDAVALYDWTLGTREITGSVGIILGVNNWVDPGAPDRNFGIDVEVIWPDGRIENYDFDELEVISIVDSDVSKE